MQKDCDPEDRKQFAAWCWAAGIPDPGKFRPQSIPLIGPMLVEGISEMLWDFGFRHHMDQQTKWIDGCAGLATVAMLTDEKPHDEPFEALAEEFLSANNPKLLEAIREVPDEEKARMLTKLEKSFSELGDLINVLKDK